MPCKRLDFEPHVGGKFETEGYHEWQNSKQTFAFTGRVLVLDGDRTKAEIIQHGFERFGDAASNLYNAYESGWDMVVPTALRNLIEKGTASG